MDMVYVPGMRHELGGKPVEQFRMRWRLAVFAEVEHRGNQRLSKMPEPDVVYCHTRGNRIIFRCDPVGQRQPPSGAGFGIDLADRRIAFVGLSDISDLLFELLFRLRRLFVVPGASLGFEM